jgi:hypothetical protein
MEDPYELALAMLGLALAAVMLVARGLYLISTPSLNRRFLHLFLVVSSSAKGGCQARDPTSVESHKTAALRSRAQAI